MSDTEDAGSADQPASSEDSSGPVSGRRNWLVVARKDLLDARRSWQFYVLGAVFAVGLTVWGLEEQLILMSVGETSETPMQRGLASMARFVGFFVPLVVLVLGHASVAGERERGSIRVLLGLPVSRHDIVAGALLGRMVVVSSTLALGFLVAAPPMWLIYGDFDPVTYGGFVLSTLAFGVVFVAMAVGISAGTSTKGRSIGASIAAFGLVTFLWDVVLVLAQIATGVTPTRIGNVPDVAPAWYVFLVRFRPGRAWRVVVTDWVVPAFRSKGLEDTFYIPLSTPGPEPFYLGSWTLVAVILAWGLIPLAVGYWRFSAADIG
jgi:ABC-2 type transport system permease protein